ncbi:MAG: hypothetical protein M1481_04840 [Candidatus Thermoplasmatota archaeon]|nr:hypothetical protein [Candidatus Thermoplasmatota archaeon]MCL5963258.1 hypothetical protein [Candidatus Thermoplasmatota archaeon]
MYIDIAFIVSLLIVAIPFYFLGYNKISNAADSQKYVAILFVVGIIIGFITAYATLYLLIISVNALSLIVLVLSLMLIAIMHTLLIYIILKSDLLPKKRYYPYYGLAFGSGLALVEGGEELYVLVSGRFTYLSIAGFLFVSGWIILLSVVGYTTGYLIKKNNLMNTILYTSAVIFIFYIISISIFSGIDWLVYLSSILAILSSLIYLYLTIAKMGKIEKIVKLLKL